MPYNPVWLKARRHGRKTVKPSLPPVGTVVGYRVERYGAPLSNTVPGRDTVKIGDTLFVNGEPHAECGNCGTPIKLGAEAGFTTAVSRPEANASGAVRKPAKVSLRDRKVPILLGFREEVEYVWKDPITGEFYGEQRILRHYRPIMQSVIACDVCWATYQKTGRSFDHRESK